MNIRPFDPFVRVTFPSGATYAVRLDRSGIVLDINQQPIDDELAADMIFIKAWKLMRGEVGGHA